jgi:hypothetical protein
MKIWEKETKARKPHREPAEQEQAQEPPKADSKFPVNKFFQPPNKVREANLLPRPERAEPEAAPAQSAEAQPAEQPEAQPERPAAKIR